jgi:hypothetical protein
MDDLSYSVTGMIMFIPLQYVSDYPTFSNFVSIGISKPSKHNFKKQILSIFTILNIIKNNII